MEANEEGNNFVDSKKVSQAKKRRSVKPNTCDVCGKTLSLNYLPEHRRRHDEAKALKCTLCGQGFNMIKDLRNHIKSHLKERPFSCTICGKCFTRASLLNYHTRIHTGERPYSCNLCNLTFTRPFGLSQHKERTHSSNKGRNFKCEYNNCEKKFCTLRERDSHMDSVHARKKPFKCELCSKSFGTKISLSLHVKQHHSTDEPYRCPSAGCGKTFKLPSLVDAHVKIWHKDFTYNCPHCPLEFKKKSHLNKHMKYANSHVKLKNK